MIFIGSGNAFFLGVFIVHWIHVDIQCDMMGGQGCDGYFGMDQKGDKALTHDR